MAAKTEKTQLSLFDLIKTQKEIPPAKTEGSMNIYHNFREILSRVLSKSKFSRYQICSRMSELLTTDITVNMMNAWTADSKEGHRFPAEYLPAFCKAVDSYEPLDLLARVAGMFLLPGPEALRAEIQKLDEEIDALRQEKEKMLFYLHETQS